MNALPLTRLLAYTLKHINASTLKRIKQMLNLKTTFKPSPNIVPRKTGDEYVLVPLSNNIADMDRVYTLNETGAFIWERLDGKTDLAAILKEMQKTFDVDKATAEQDLLEFIDQLKEYLIVSG